MCPDDSTYDTVFQTKAGHALILRVHLPPGAASKPPGMTLVGVNAQHSWLDSRMRVTGYQPISSESAWSSCSMKLGSAVNAVVQHLQLNPPDVVEITDASLQRIQASMAHAQPQFQPEQQGQQHAQPQPPPRADVIGASSEPPPDYSTVLHAEEDSIEMSHMSIPTVPAVFPELEIMSKEDMQELLNEEDKFRKFVEEMSAVRTLIDLQTSIQKGNVETAEANLKQEEELAMLHAEVAALQSDLREKVETFQKLETKQNKLCAPPDHQDVIRKLKAAKKEAYGESEELAAAWIDGGNGDVDQFIDNFMARRIVHHTRAAKLERLSAA